MSSRTWARSAPDPDSDDQQPNDQQLDVESSSADDDPGASHPLLRAVELTAWTAKHDNGWVTVVCEQPDGTFAVLLGPPDARDVAPEAIVANGDVGRATADTLLRARSGHESCTADCQRWQRERHLVMLLAADAEEFGGSWKERRLRRERRTDA